MQAMLLPDYILGNTFSPDYKETFVEQAPTFIYSIQDIEFEISPQGDYKYKENSELYHPFMQWSYHNQSIGNFFIIFKRYLDSPLNIIQKSPKLEDYQWHDFKEEINCYIKPNNLRDEEDELIEGVFVSLVPASQELVVVYFYKGAKKVGHFRSNLTNVKMGLHLREHDRKVLNLLRNYDLKRDELVVKKDNIKKKYVGRFTQLPYVIV